MSQRLLSLAAIISLATLSCTNASIFNSQFTIKAEKNKEFNESCLIETFEIKSGNIADCLEHCLENCRCQSFQICKNTECQVCSRNKEENSSLLHDKDGCVYAMYEIRHLTETQFQKLDDQCSGMSCNMKYNCCEQSGLCPKNKICKPINSLAKPWKRFTCECPDGYHGDNCDEPITSCQGHANRSRESGMYKVADSETSVYEVYCHFDSVGAWTLVQSYSYANGSQDSEVIEFQRPLSENIPVSENALTWSGYRLSKPRMQSIKKDSGLLLFTCDYEKEHGVDRSDYVQFPLGSITDVLELKGITSYVTIGDGRGKIGEYDLNQCKILLSQDTDEPLHVHLNHYYATNSAACKFNESHCSYNNEYFGSYRYTSQRRCFYKIHRCVQNANSTTQLWFGTRNPSVKAAYLDILP